MATKKKVTKVEVIPEPTTEPKKPARPPRKPKTETVVTHTIAAPTTVVTTTAPVGQDALNSAMEEANKVIISEVAEQNAEPEPAKPPIIEKIVTLWHKWGWVVVIALAATVIVLLFLELKHSKIVRSIKETKQTEVKIENGKARLEESEANLSYMQKSIISDSAITEKINELYVLIEAHKKYDAQVIEQNKILNRQKDELQNKYSTASDDSLRVYGERAKQK